MSDEAKVVLSLDIEKSAALKGLKEFEGQLRGFQRDANKALSLGEEWSNLSRGKKIGIELGGASMLADLGSTALRGFGLDSAAGVLDETAKSAKQFGTMLAPLGGIAAAAGTGLGALVGAVRGTVNAHVEAQKRLLAVQQSFKDASADVAIAARRATTDEEKAERQHAAREQMADLRIKLERGATISDLDVTTAALWDRDLTSQLLDARKKQGGKAATAALAPLENALWALNDLGSFDALSAKAEEERKAGRSGRKAVWTNLNASVQSLGPEMLAALQRGTGFDSALDELYQTLHATKDEGDIASGSTALKIAGLGNSGSLRTPQADALSAAGFGYTGNPMQETESLLREISSNTRRVARGAIPTVAA